MRPLFPRQRTLLNSAVTYARCHVWTAPGWQVKTSRRVASRCSHVFGLLRGSHDRWPYCPPRIGSRSIARIQRCTGTSGLSRSPDRPALHYVLFALPTLHITPDVPAKPKPTENNRAFRKTSSSREERAASQKLLRRRSAPNVPVRRDTYEQTSGRAEGKHRALDRGRVGSISDPSTRITS